MSDNYSSTAVETTLQGDIDGSATAFTVGSASGYPAAPFKVTLAPDTGSEEIVRVGTKVGAVFSNVTRGVDGTVGLAHSTGDEVRHQVTAEDIRLSRQHEDAEANVHGVGATSDVVGTLTAQTLESKTINGSLNTLSAIPQSAVNTLVSDLAALVAADAALVAADAALTAADTATNTRIDDWDAGAPAIVAFTAAPSTYPSGFSIKKILVSGGWPVDGYVLTFKLADNTRAIQFFGEGGTGSNSASYFRHYNGSAWQTHRELSNPAFGGNWLTVLAADVQRPIETLNTDANTALSISYVNGTTTCGHSFVAPPSGQVWVSVYGNMVVVNGIGSARQGFLSFELRAGGTVGSGTIHTAADDLLAMSAGTGVVAGQAARLHATARFLVTGLTPGSTYNVRTMQRVSASTDITFTCTGRKIATDPVL